MRMRASWLGALFVDDGPRWWRRSVMPRIAFAGSRLWLVRPPRRSGPVPRVPVRLGAEWNRFQHRARGPAVHAAHVQFAPTTPAVTATGREELRRRRDRHRGRCGRPLDPDAVVDVRDIRLRVGVWRSAGHRSREWPAIRRGRTTRRTPRWTVTVPSMSVRWWTSSTPFGGERPVTLSRAAWYCLTAADNTSVDRFKRVDRVDAGVDTLPHESDGAERFASGPARRSPRQ